MNRSAMGVPSQRCCWAVSMFIERLLTLLIIAKMALWFINTNYFTAHGAEPVSFLIFNKTTYTELLYVFQIFNHTHIILSSIALIQMIQPAAREAITTETGFDSTCRYFLQFLILL